MARGINKVILVGNIGNDPEVKFMPSGKPVVALSLATSRAWKDKNTGQPVEQTDWHRLVFFDRLAEIVGEHLKKGSKIYAEGSLRNNKWQDKDGNDRITTEILVKEMQMLDSKGAAPQGGQSQSNQSQSRPQQSSQQQPQVTQVGNSQIDNFDDDIPF